MVSKGLERYVARNLLSFYALILLEFRFSGGTWTSLYFGGADSLAVHVEASEVAQGSGLKNCPGDAEF
jgi:hypothetical protein